MIHLKGGHHKKAGSLIFIVFLLFTWIGISAEETIDIRDKITETAQRYLGVPYIYGASSPNGFDCSGFVFYVYREAAGIPLPRSSKLIWQKGTPIPLSKAQPGDILVFDTAGGTPSHVALLLDANRIIHAVSQGPRTGVLISSLNDPYFSPRLIGARSFLPLSPGVSPAKASPAPAPQPGPPSSPQPGPQPGPLSGPAKGQSALGAVGDIPIDTIPFTITNEPVIYTDKIPALAGSAVQFVIKNGTSREGVFEVLFFKMAMDPAKTQTIRRDRVHMKADQVIELDPIILTEPGQYKLILKTGSNLKRVERVWKVVSGNNR